MNLYETTRGGLICQEVDDIPGGNKPQFIVLLCHGFGAPGTDLVNVAPELLRVSPDLAESVRFVFPAAPVSLDELGMPGGRAWWHLDVARLNDAIQRGEFRDLREDLPEGLPEARAMLLELIDEVCDEFALDSSRIVLGGFSQGSMISTDIALRMEQSPAALCIWSGTLLCESVWRELAPNRAGLSVIQSHGTTDPILPFQGAIWLRDMLMAAGLDVEFIEFPGVHTIPIQALQSFAIQLIGLVRKQHG